jgi:hypothetical protein
MLAREHRSQSTEGIDSYGCTVQQLKVVSFLCKKENSKYIFSFFFAGNAVEERSLNSSLAFNRRLA